MHNRNTGKRNSISRVKALRNQCDDVPRKLKPTFRRVKTLIKLYYKLLKKVRYINCLIIYKRGIQKLSDLTLLLLLKSSFLQTLLNYKIFLQKLTGLILLLLLKSSSLHRGVGFKLPEIETPAITYARRVANSQPGKKGLAFAYTYAIPDSSSESSSSEDDSSEYFEDESSDFNEDNNTNTKLNKSSKENKPEDFACKVFKWKHFQEKNQNNLPVKSPSLKSFIRDNYTLSDSSSSTKPSFYYLADSPPTFIKKADDFYRFLPDNTEKNLEKKVAKKAINEQKNNTERKLTGRELQEICKKAVYKKIAKKAINEQQDNAGIVDQETFEHQKKLFKNFSKKNKKQQKQEDILDKSFMFDYFRDLKTSEGTLKLYLLNLKENKVTYLNEEEQKEYTLTTETIYDPKTKSNKSYFKLKKGEEHYYCEKNADMMITTGKMIDNVKLDLGSDEDSKNP